MEWSSAPPRRPEATTLTALSLAVASAEEHAGSALKGPDAELLQRRSLARAPKAETGGTEPLLWEHPLKGSSR